MTEINTIKIIDIHKIKTNNLININKIKIIKMTLRMSNKYHLLPINKMHTNFNIK